MVKAYTEKRPPKEIDALKRMIINLYEDDFYKIDPSGRISMMYQSIPAQLAKGTHCFSITFATKKKRERDFPDIRLATIEDGSAMLQLP